MFEFFWNCDGFLICWKLSQFWIGKTLPDQQLIIFSDQQIWQIAHRATYIQWLRLQEILLTLQNEYTDWEQALQHPSNVKEQVSAHHLSVMYHTLDIP